MSREISADPVSPREFGNGQPCPESSSRKLSTASLGRVRAWPGFLGICPNVSQHHRLDGRRRAPSEGISRQTRNVLHLAWVGGEGTTRLSPRDSCGKLLETPRRALLVLDEAQLLRFNSRVQMCARGKIRIRHVRTPAASLPCMLHTRGFLRYCAWTPHWAILS